MMSCHVGGGDGDGAGAQVERAPVVAVGPHGAPVVAVDPHGAPVVAVDPHGAPVVAVAAPPAAPPGIDEAKKAALQMVNIFYIGAIIQALPVYLDTLLRKDREDGDRGRRCATGIFVCWSFALFFSWLIFGSASQDYDGPWYYYVLLLVLNSLAVISGLICWAWGLDWGVDWDDGWRFSGGVMTAVLSLYIVCMFVVAYLKNFKNRPRA